MEFSLGDTPTTGSVLSTNFFLQDKRNKKIIVPTTTIEDIFNLNDIRQCKLLKVDCEGSEYAIFENMNLKILEKIQYIFLEVHPVAGSSSESLLKFLNDFFEIRYQKTKTSKRGLYDQLIEVFGKKKMGT